jgi:hypothetical protein
MQGTTYRNLKQLYILGLVAWALVLMARNCAAQAKGSVFIDFLEKDTETTVACRTKILDARGKEVRARGVLFEQGWNLIEERMEFRGLPGDYTFRAFHGPQFSAASGGFTLDRNAAAEDIVTLPRHSNLAEEGWIGGDLLASVPAEKTIRWLPAEDLSMAVLVSEQAVSSESSQRVEAPNGYWVDQYSFHDTRPGSGGLVFHHWMPPAEVPRSLASSRLLVMAKSKPGETENPHLPVHTEIQKLWARDVPIWLASGRVDSIQLLSSHLTYDGSQGERVDVLEAPDGYFKGQRGAGRLVEKIYWQTLEAGFRIPPSAGSGFGNTVSPLGYNRIYAVVGSVTASGWWEAMRQGRSFVTNGPLLRAQVNGEYPGHVFRLEPGETLALNVSVALTVADPVEYLDVIFNGQSLYQARLDEYAKQGGRIPPLQIKESGWLVVRVVTERDFTYRFATTAPYYVEQDGKPRISRSSIEFFQRWLEKSAAKINEQDDSAQQAAMPYIIAAREFWRERLDISTAE